jgi:hypothetical protein
MSGPPSLQSSAALGKLRAAPLGPVRERGELSAEALALIAGCPDTPAALEVLETGGLAADAVKLVAHALPRREGVWWACMCARATMPGDLQAADRAALDAAETWVRKPSDENRRAAFAAAEQARFGTPEAWAGVAAFWSGDSMAPAGQPAVPPAPHLAGLALAGAVTLASVRADPLRQAARLARFLASARDIASGGPGRIEAEVP